MASAGSLEENNFKIPSVFGSRAAYKTAPKDFPPSTPTDSVKASWLNGFPEQTFRPDNAPSGADFNGLFGLLSGLLMNTQMGQMINTYDATYQGNIGGYPNGAIIWFVPNNNWSNRMLFQSTADGNKEVPYNTTTSTVGTGWKQLLPVNIQTWDSESFTGVQNSTKTFTLPFNICDSNNIPFANIIPMVYGTVVGSNNWQTLFNLCHYQDDANRRTNNGYGLFFQYPNIIKMSMGWGCNLYPYFGNSCPWYSVNIIIRIVSI